MLHNPQAIGERDRAIYANAYNSPDAIRAANGWYQTFGQDIIDLKSYPRLTLPVLGLAVGFAVPAAHRPPADVGA